MANVKVKTKTKETRKFALRLSEREALAVQAVIAWSVSYKSSADSLGMDALDVMNALYDAGLDYFMHPVNRTVHRDDQGNLVFDQYPKDA